MRLSPGLRALTPLIACLMGAAWLLAAPEAAADASKCRSQIARVAGSFAHKRMKLIARCEDSRRCDPVEQARKLALLETKSIKKLRLRCSNLTNGELGLGQTCPDPSGRCTQVLDSDQAIVECVLCLVRETVDPLIRRIRGRDADIAETCGGCSATPCNDAFFCETRPGRCEDSTMVGICLEIPSVCPEIFDPACGCNGTTYGNDCLRQQARVGRFHEGPCMTRCDGSSGNSCPAGTTCTGLPGHCDVSTDAGICVPIPDACSEGSLQLGYPICGCDAVTYEDPCAALLEGGGVRHEGACENL